MLAHYGEVSDSFTCPEWYPLIAAARFYNVPPWVMMEQSIYWQDLAGIASEAEAKAQKVIAAHNP